MNTSRSSYSAPAFTLTVVEGVDGFPAVFTVRPVVGRAVEVFVEGAAFRRPGVSL